MHIFRDGSIDIGFDVEFGFNALGDDIIAKLRDAVIPFLVREKKEAIREIAFVIRPLCREYFIEEPSWRDIADEIYSKKEKILIRSAKMSAETEAAYEWLKEYESGELIHESARQLKYEGLFENPEAATKRLETLLKWHAEEEDYPDDLDTVDWKTVAGKVADLWIGLYD